MPLPTLDHITRLHNFTSGLVVDACVCVLQAQELARRLGPLADRFPASLRNAVRLHRVPKDLEGEVWCVTFGRPSL